MIMKRFFISVFCILVSLQVFAQDIDTKQIWYNNNHSAFTSLVLYKGKFYCAFREAGSHIFDEDGEARGIIRILSSRNGRRWKPVAVIAKPGFDLRDPWLSVMPDGRLMVLMGESLYVNKKSEYFMPQVSFSEDGKRFSTPKAIKLFINNEQSVGWTWHITWHNGVGYSISYWGGNNYLVSTVDGITYNSISQLDGPGFLDEAVCHFTDNDDIIVITRREKTPNSALLWKAAAPYIDWEFMDTKTYIGGPDFILLPKGRLLVGGRSLCEEGQITSLWIGDLEGHLTKLTDLHSPVIDCSYPSFVIKGKYLFFTYYASFSKVNDAAIYVGKVRLSKLLRNR